MKEEEEEEEIEIVEALLLHTARLGSIRASKYQASSPHHGASWKISTPLLNGFGGSKYRRVAFPARWSKVVLQEILDHCENSWRERRGAIRGPGGARK